MKISKKLSLVMATAATLSIIGATTAFANNCKDTSWGFSKWERVEITGVRDKEDATSAYGSVTSGGEKRTTTFKLVDDWGNDFKDPKTGKTKPISKSVTGNDWTYVGNYANEFGYSQVRMKVSRIVLGVEASGLWSPDSV